MVDVTQVSHTIIWTFYNDAAFMITSALNRETHIWDMGGFLRQQVLHRVADQVGGEKKNGAESRWKVEAAAVPQEQLVIPDNVTVTST